jgi:hypothetical protein
MRHSAILLIVTAAVLNVTLTGCNHQIQQEDQEGAVSIQATIEADCIVHYFKTNASAYITQQQHGYNPEAGLFQATSTEPVGTVQCSLVQDVFESSGQKKGALSDLPGSFWNKDLATILFYVFCGGGNLLDTHSMTTGENVKIEGQWYKPFTPAWPTDMKVTLLQSLDSSRIERVQLSDSQNGLTWLADCYNHRYSKELNERVPRTIDVFDIRNGVASKERMVRFDYKEIRKITWPEKQN